MKTKILKPHNIFRTGDWVTLEPENALVFSFHEQDASCGWVRLKNAKDLYPIFGKKVSGTRWAVRREVK
jgi:hypothetical protein